MSRRRKWAVGTLSGLCLLVITLIVLPVLVEKPLRNAAERQFNACVKGYTVHLGGLDVRPMSLSVHIRDLDVTQDLHPDLPIARIPRISASLRLPPMLHGRIVTDILISDAHADATRAHILRELESPIVLVKECAALKAMHRVDAIDRASVRNASVSYVDRNDARALTVRALNAELRNIQTAGAAPDAYPSTVTMEGAVFDDGHLRIDGAADLLRQPHAAFKGRIEAAHIALGSLGPLVGRYGLRITRGTMEASGSLEYSPDVKALDFEYVTVNGLHADYLHGHPSLQNTKELVKGAVGRGNDRVDFSGVLLKARHLRAKDTTVGFVNDRADPRYRVFLADIDAQMDHFSNRLTDETATARVTGHFMGSGQIVLAATLRPETDGPDFDLSIQVEGTEVRTMNDLLRAHDGRAVTSGLFSVYSEFHVKGGRVAGEHLGSDREPRSKRLQRRYRARADNCREGPWVTCRAAGTLVREAKSRPGESMSARFRPAPSGSDGRARRAPGGCLCAAVGQISPGTSSPLRRST
jgi:hypothetical protein